MTTETLAPVGEHKVQSTGLDAAATIGRSRGRVAIGLVGQYGVLIALAVVVLLPIFFTVVQAMSVLAEYTQQGKPPHPVSVDWNDRTWFTGGWISVVTRTAVLVAALAWLQKVGAGVRWGDRKALFTPRRLVAILGGSLYLTVILGPTFASLYEADGNSEWWIIAAMVGVGALQTVGYWDPSRRSTAVAVISGLATGVTVVGVAVIVVGASVWTDAWTSADLGPAMRRSLTMAVIITTSQVVTSIMAAYAFVFLRFPFKRLLFAVFMGTLLLPLEVTLVGNVALIRQLEWMNSMQALVLPFAASALGTFLIRQGFRGIPPEIQDATRIDGYSHIAFLTKFAVPLTRPVVASFTVIAALQAWNQYLWPRAIIENDSLNTLQIQLRSIVADNIAQLNLTIAAALVAAVPVAIVLIAFQRQIIRGLTAGAVK